jgi:hypothetical protein
MADQSQGKLLRRCLSWECGKPGMLFRALAAKGLSTALLECHSRGAGRRAR